MMKRWIVVGTILFLICSSIPIFASIPSRDPHVHLGGEEGLNGWYVSGVFVTIDSNLSWFQIDNGSWTVYTTPFTISKDGRHLLVATGNYNGSNWTEEYHINIDQTNPVIYVIMERHLDRMVYTANCSDSISGVNRVEFYMGGTLRETDVGEPYQYEYFFDLLPYTLTGIIFFPRYVEENITIPVLVGIIKTRNLNMTLRAIVYDNAGNQAFWELGRYPWWWPSYVLVLSRTLVVPNHYTGHLGRFFVHATFYDG